MEKQTDEADRILERAAAMAPDGLAEGARLRTAEETSYHFTVEVPERA